MRPTPLALFALLTLLLAPGCHGGDGGGGAAPPEEEALPVEEPVTEHTYGPGRQITVDLTMYAGEDGGRTTPFFSGYRTTVRFEHRGQVAGCTARLPVELGEFRPGESHVIGLECDTEVTVHVDVPGLALLDGDDEHGSGKVVFTEEA
ncbi:hypothetical protein A6A08_21830 [Nocardiopsis sp. TSRI0078]|uniref:hypothetical protein n=1 Tax=unclassified Nocardiopsis TaxID=2649073 RepID=UPI00093D8D9C|nr:hypothetical protein [Nocardiopsis sp. TSRI0078]OKI21015.1 hypothetical protein A6A08_21830 [Nocardiopsis sp. TSRI0078]